MRREANFQTLLRHYLKANPFSYACAMELKQTTSDSLPFSSVKEHQIDALLACKQSQFLYKIPDDSMGIKPFDMVYLTQCPAYIVIRYPKAFYFIDVETFLLEEKRSNRKSLTSERAESIAIRSVFLKK